MIFSAAALRDPAHGRKRAAAAALVHQPEDAKRTKMSKATASAKSSSSSDNGGKGRKGSKGGTGSKGSKGDKSGKSSKGALYSARTSKPWWRGGLWRQHSATRALAL